MSDMIPSPPPRPDEPEPSSSLALTGRPSRPRDEDRTTRKPLVLWDRIKLILLFLGAWVIMFWAALAQYDPSISTGDAFYQTIRSYYWLLVLAMLEGLRQIHYLISERSAGYYKFWTERVFRRFQKRVGRMNDWTRYRLSRVLKILFVLMIADLVLAKVYHESPAIAIFHVPIAIVRALPFALQMFLYAFLLVFQFGVLFWFLSRGGVETYMPDDLKTRYGDVKGQDHVLERVKENIIYLERPEEIEEKGGYVPGGILLWGPPGTGKTLMAQAVAGETNRPFVYVEPAAFMNMFFGVGVLKVKSLYRKLRRLALRYGGVIVFFDEADSLGNRGAIAQGGWSFDRGDSPWTTGPACNGLSYLSRATVEALFRDSLSGSVSPSAPGKNAVIAGFGMGSAGMGTLQALLSEMSGLKKPRGFFNRIVRRVLGMRPKPPPKYRILHIFATNMPQALDEAMLRPGRIDRIYKVGFPSKEGRKDTFELYLSKKKHALTEDEMDKLATITAYHSGASIEDIVNEALAIAIRDGRDTVTYQDVIRAKHLKDHGVPDDTEYIERERHAVAIHEACHALVAYRLRHHAVIDMATIERRGDVGGFVSFIPPEDQFVNWKSEYEVDIMCSLASLAGEKMFFDEDNSAGVAGDLRAATAVATRMEGFLGMGSAIGSHYVTKYNLLAGPGFAGEDGTDRSLLETDLGRRVEETLHELFQKTHALLEENRHEILAVAHALEAHKTMSGDDVAAIIEGHEGPLVDGRSYQAPDLEHSLAAYHRMAVEAHRAHDPVALSLPELAEFVPGDVSGNGDVVVEEERDGDGDGAGDDDGNGRVRTGESEPPLEDAPAES